MFYDACLNEKYAVLVISSWLITIPSFLHSFYIFYPFSSLPNQGVLKVLSYLLFTKLYFYTLIKEQCVHFRWNGEGCPKIRNYWKCCSDALIKQTMRTIKKIRVSQKWGVILGYNVIKKFCPVFSPADGNYMWTTLLSIIASIQIHVYSGSWIMVC